MTRQLNVRVPESLRDLLPLAAACRRMSVSAYVAFAIRADMLRLATWPEGASLAVELDRLSAEDTERERVGA